MPMHIYSSPSLSQDAFRFTGGLNAYIYTIYTDAYIYDVALALASYRMPSDAYYWRSKCIYIYT